MMFRLLHDPVSGSMGYLLADEQAREAVLIDPRGADAPALRTLLGEHRLRLCWVLRTHDHDAMLIRESSALAMLGAMVVERCAPRGISGVLRFGREQIQVMETPGHTERCLSFGWRDRIFCGGLMSADSCPYQPIPAVPKRLWDTVQRHIFSKPGETLLFSGHSRLARVVSTVAEQRLNHPWVAASTREALFARARAIASVQQPLMPNHLRMPLQH